MWATASFLKATKSRQKMLRLGLAHHQWHKYTCNKSRAAFVVVERKEEETYFLQNTFKYEDTQRFPFPIATTATHSACYIKNTRKAWDESVAHSFVHGKAAHGEQSWVECWVCSF